MRRRNCRYDCWPISLKRTRGASLQSRYTTPAAAGSGHRYLVTNERHVLAVVGFSASAWKAATRYRFIGWIVCPTRSTPAPSDE